MLLKQDNTINDLRDKQNSHKARNGLKTGRKLPFICCSIIETFGIRTYKKALQNVKNGANEADKVRKEACAKHRSNIR